jgi:predicted nuclease of restriction endonuclease-like (RecB) superfamily
MNEVLELVAEQPDDRRLFGDVAGLIEAARSHAAAQVNSALVVLYWSIGRRIREDVLGCERAEYGTETVKRLADRLTARYGRGYGRRNLFSMIEFAEAYPDLGIVQTLSAQLAWSHFIVLLQVPDQQKREFLTLICARERWSGPTLRGKLDDKLFERAVVAAGPISCLEEELAELRVTGATSARMAFRDPYVLDFLGLPPQHSEREFETAILSEMQRFLTELGAGFAFLERQKRITVDGADYHLDLLFFNLRLKRLVVIELKTRDLEPGDKGQMELYLAWLNRHEREDWQEPAIGLILCRRKGAQQAELLGLDRGDIRAARYLTDHLADDIQRRFEEVVDAERERMRREEEAEG